MRYEVDYQTLGVFLALPAGVMTYTYVDGSSDIDVDCFSVGELWRCLRELSLGARPEDTLLGSVSGTVIMGAAALAGWREGRPLASVGRPLVSL